MQPMLTMALRAARKAGEILSRAADDLDIKKKELGAAAYLSEVVRNVERAVISDLQKAYPDHGFNTREAGNVEGQGLGKDTVWLINALDGESNFTHAQPHFAFTIACQIKGRIEHAIVIDPIRNEEFCASRGQGCQLNGKRVRVSKHKQIEGAMLSTEYPAHSGDSAAFNKILAKTSAQAEGIRQAGVASLDLAYVAAGRFDASWQFAMTPATCAASTLLVLEAGGLVSDFTGGQNFLDSGNVVCGSAKCFKALVQAIAPEVAEAQ